ncbi:MAG TPA: hypothetical protein VFS49_11160 [Croceibacterium sp.]|nr:hypothetical protein [Croceibacterium sp.]
MKRTLLLAAALGGCAHKPEVAVREVPVPTPVTCVDPRRIPEEPPRVANRFNGNARHDLVILADNAQDLRAWGQEMRTLLEMCVGRKPEG